MTDPCLACSDKPWWCRGCCSSYMKYRIHKDKEIAAMREQRLKSEITAESFARNDKRNHNPHRYGARG